MNQQDRQLTISGERRRKAAAAPGDAERDEDAEPASRQQRRERRFGKFKRQVKLPETADCDAVSARCAAPCPGGTWAHGCFFFLGYCVSSVPCYACPSACKPGGKHSWSLSRTSAPQVRGCFCSALARAHLSPACACAPHTCAHSVLTCCVLGGPGRVDKGVLTLTVSKKAEAAQPLYKDIFVD